MTITNLQLNCSKEFSIDVKLQVALVSVQNSITPAEQATRTPKLSSYPPRSVLVVLFFEMFWIFGSLTFC